MRNIAELTSVLLRRLIETVELVCSCIYSIILSIMHNKPRRVVIYYHSIKKQDIKSFEKQMGYLAGNFRVVKASQINTVPANDDNVLVAITFDDAFESVVENALPILKKYDLGAAVFVPTGSFGLHPQWPIDRPWAYPHGGERVMSEKQIAGLSCDGFEIFSHTVSHAVLTELEDERLAAELVESKQTLEKITNKGVLAISYPLGAYNAKVCEATKRAGYEFGFTTESCRANSSGNNFEIGRFSVSATDSLIKFKLKVIGAYHITKYLRALKRILMPSHSKGDWPYGL